MSPPAPRPSGQVESPEARFSIPAGYGDDRIVLMVKDPWWVYAYWEIQPGTERAARGQLLPHEVAGLQSVLRIYDVTDTDFPAQPPVTAFDIGLSGLATNWYVNTNAPNRSFLVDIGLLTQAGRFLRLARSNRVTTPRAAPSDVIDEQWMTTEEAYARLFGATVGLGRGASPMGWLQAFPQQVFSGGWSSHSLVGAGRAPSIRGFWYRVAADLVLHGTTEPKSAVTIQGQAVAVRKDGSFSVRLALPEGAQTVGIRIVSPDGRESRTVTPVVSVSWAGAIGSDATRAAARKFRASQRAPQQGPAV